MRCTARNRRRLFKNATEFVRVDIALGIEDEMLQIFLLAFFMVQFLVILGVILFAVLFSRSEVPLKGDGGLERIVLTDRSEQSLQPPNVAPTACGKVTSTDSRAPLSRLTGVRPPVFAVLSVMSVGGVCQNTTQRRP